MARITSLQNPRVKDAVRLRDRRHREKQGRILIDGARELARAITAGVQMFEIFVCQPLCTGEAARALLPMLPERGAEIWHGTQPGSATTAFGLRIRGGR